MNKSDLELVNICKKNNDLKAFEVLIKRHQNKVRSIIYRFLNNPEDLKDASQEVFIKAFKNLRSFKGNSSFSTWLYQITANTCKDKLRAKKLLEAKIISITQDDLLKIPDNKEIDTDLNIEENKELISKLIKSLPLEQQMTIVLHDIEDFSYEEISKILNCPLGTVKSRIFNARKALKDKFKPYLPSYCTL